VSSRRIEVAVAFVLIALAAVVVIGSRLAADAPRADAIAETTDGVWAAAGVPDDAVNRGDVARQTYGTTAACADLESDERWASTGTSRVGPDRAPQSAILDGATGHLQDRGFTVARYRSSGSETRQLVASSVADEQSLELFVEGDGTATLRILAGPCAALLAEPPGPPYVPDA
jgi:hypothetical protein